MSFRVTCLVRFIFSFSFCRLLFNSGSQLSYISSSLFKKLYLKSEGTQQFKLNVFGANSTVENLNYVKVKIESLFSIESIFVKCYVKDICKPILNQYIKFAKNSYPHLKHLNLAVYNNDRDLSVDILIGSNYYWDIIEIKIVRGESGPVAIKCKVGYILSGSFCSSAIPNSTAFVCHTLKSSSKIVTDT